MIYMNVLYTCNVVHYTTMVVPNKIVSFPGHSAEDCEEINSRPWNDSTSVQIQCTVSVLYIKRET